MSKRRPSGDGLIRKRSDGRWEGRIVVGHRADGYPIYRSVFAKTQRELMPKLNQLKNVWEGRYSPIVNGQRITRNIYAGSIEECEEKLMQMIAEMKEEYGMA